MSRIMKNPRPTWHFVTFLVALLMPASVSAQTGKEEVLKNMPQIAIAVYVNPGARQHEISDVDLRAEALVLLRNNVPKLQLAELGSDRLSITVSLDNLRIGDTVVGYHGVFTMVVLREARITAINKTGDVTVWQLFYAFAGSPKEGARSHVSKLLNQFMTQFAADWLLANP